MNRRVRRGLVLVAVVISLVGGAFSIRVAADLALAAAPPPAPPVSMSELQAQLTAEQARAAYLQQQLEDLLGVTGELTAALDSTSAQIDIDGSTAAQLRDRLKAAEARLAKVTRLLKKAAARLVALGQAAPPIPPAAAVPVADAGGAAPAPTAAPAAPVAAVAAAVFSLAIAPGPGGLVGTWTTCPVDSFDRYALVRSLDSEIHYPPEDRDTVVAEVSSQTTTSATDGTAPSGRLWYRLYCLTNRDNELKTAGVTPTVAITAP